MRAHKELARVHMSYMYWSHNRHSFKNHPLSVHLPLAWIIAAWSTLCNYCTSPYKIIYTTLYLYKKQMYSFYMYFPWATGFDPVDFSQICQFALDISNIILWQNDLLSYTNFLQINNVYKWRWTSQKSRMEWERISFKTKIDG